MTNSFLINISDEREKASVNIAVPENAIHNRILQSEIIENDFFGKSLHRSLQRQASNQFEAKGGKWDPRKNNFRDRRVRQPIGGWKKRGIDIVGSLSALILLSPVIIVIALLIYIRSGGGVIFAQKRVGYGGRLFNCYKFRTMAPNAEQLLNDILDKDEDAAREWRQHQKLKNDPRITPLGYFLRKTSLDELPQLFNILIGDMSCVGPRPVVEAEIDRYGDSSAHYKNARPGITGLWQVSGRNSLSYDKRVALDSLYVTNWSLPVDIVIIAKTFPALIRTDETA